MVGKKGCEKKGSDKSCGRVVREDVGVVGVRRSVV